jgi:hypothetical protein
MRERKLTPGEQITNPGALGVDGLADVDSPRQGSVRPPYRSTPSDLTVSCVTCVALRDAAYLTPSTITSINNGDNGSRPVGSRRSPAARGRCRREALRRPNWPANAIWTQQHVRRRLTRKAPTRTAAPPYAVRNALCHNASGPPGPCPVSLSRSVVGAMNGMPRSREREMNCEGVVCGPPQADLRQSSQRLLA